MLASLLFLARSAPAQEYTDLTLVDPTNHVHLGTYWLLSDYGKYRVGEFGGPRPVLPNAYTNCDIYYWTNQHSGAIQYVIDDRAIAQARESNADLQNGPGLMTADEMDGGSGEGGSMDSYSYPSNALWLSIDAATNTTIPNSGIIYLTAHGTVPDQTYEILSRDSLTNIGWNSEGTIIGAAGQNWTATIVAAGTRTNALYLWARSYADSDGDGLPDWWEVLYGLDRNSADAGNTGIPDGYKDLANDGWTTLYKYEHGLNPRTAITPPPPRNVQARLDSTGTNVILTWASGGGPVLSYGIESTVNPASPEIGAVSATTLSFTDSSGYDYSMGSDFEPVYRIRAYFPNGSHVDSEPIAVTKDRLDLFTSVDPTILFGAGVVRGSGGQPYLTVLSVPPDLAYIRLHDWLTTSNLDLYPSNFVNGCAALPVSVASWVSVQAQPFATNGDFGKAYALNEFVFSEDASYPSVTNVINGAAQMKESLKFLVRSASATEPFNYYSAIDTSFDMEGGPGLFGQPYFAWRPEAYFARPPSSTNYEYYGFHLFSSNLNYSVVDLRRPVREHYRWRNFVFDPNEFLNGRFDTGADSDVMTDNRMRELVDSKYKYPGSLDITNFPLAFDSSTTSWIYAFDSPWMYNPDDDSWHLWPGLFMSGTNIVLGNLRNCYGLPLQSLRCGEQEIFYPGDIVPDNDYPYFSGFEAPVLQTVDYYFASETPFFASPDPFFSYSVTNRAPLLPGSPTFSPTNPAPLLIAPFGRQFIVSGWAKMAITNGYPGKFAYLEQYFDKAYKIDATGGMTTNQTGLLSPYGEFFPTEPGPTALVTMPDIDPPYQRGTGVVNVIKLQLDVNHDGVMDLTFGGPDNTSQRRPFVFWINDDWDASGHDVNPQNMPRAHDYSDAFVGSARDLEDFARLWIIGLPALPSNSGYSVGLSWRNAIGDPAVRLFRSCEMSGGAEYLTDTNVAGTQALRGGYGSAVDPIAISRSIPFAFPANFFATQGTNAFFLFEGAGIGSGELVLTVSRGTNVLAETSAWIELRQVKDLYEHAIITNVTDETPNTGVSAYSEDNLLAPGADEEHSLIVYIHGWRMNQFDYDTFSASMFKRLYWQGFRGRFASLRWPTLSSETDGSIGQFLTFNRSEFRAFQSGRGASDYLAHLRNRFPDYAIGAAAHSMGGIVIMEALRRDLSLGRQSLNSLVLMQAAVPAHCYDTNLPNYTVFTTAESNAHTPNTYRGYPGPIGGAVRNRIVNFYNTNDFALVTGTVPLFGGVNWEADQVGYKPDTGFGYSTDGTNSYKGSTALTDDRQIMAFVARPRSKAAGAMPDVGGAITAAGEVDLKANYGFNTGWDEHSAEFNWNIQKLGPFYRALLDTLFPSP